MYNFCFKNERKLLNINKIKIFKIIRTYLYEKNLICFLKFKLKKKKYIYSEREKNRQVKSLLYEILKADSDYYSKNITNYHLCQN